jgi:hypothetical protein
VLFLSVLHPWAIAARTTEAYRSMMVFDYAVLVLAVLPFVLFYGRAGRRAGHGWLKTARRLPLALLIGIGMSASQTSAVWRGLTVMGGTFRRTPKTGGRDQGTGATRMCWVELALTAYTTAGVVWAASHGVFASLPFQLLFLFGYGAVCHGSLRRPARTARRSGGHVSHQSSGPTSQAPLESRPRSTP